MTRLIASVLLQIVLVIYKLWALALITVISVVLYCLISGVVQTVEDNL